MIVFHAGLCRHFNTPKDLQLKPMAGTTDKYLVSCMLDTCVFSSGMISRLYEPELTYGILLYFTYFSEKNFNCILLLPLETLLANLKILNETICTLHANYISGNEKKMERMKEYGFWFPF